MPAFVIRFHDPADSTRTDKDAEDRYSISYDHFYEHYAITTTFSNSKLKPTCLNTLGEVKQFLHALYKYVNLDMAIKSGNYIAYAQIDGGMFPSITVPRRDLLDDDVIQTIDQALDVWATITVPGVHLYTTIQHATSASVPAPAQSSVFCHPATKRPEARNPWACCEPGGWMYEQNHRLFN